MRHRDTADPITVLHVDDEPSFADLQRTYLEEIFDTDLEIVTLTDPTETQDRLESTPVDCVVCDYDMPELDGLELLEAVRETDPYIPFVLLTSRGDETVASEAIRLGATDYVPKPSGSKEYRTLANRIQSAVTGYRRERSAREHAATLDAALERVTDPVASVDDDRIVYANDAAETFFDLAETDIPGADARTIIHRLVSERGTDGDRDDALTRAMNQDAPVVVDGRDLDQDDVSELRCFPSDDGVTILVRREHRD